VVSLRLDAPASAAAESAEENEDDDHDENDQKDAHACITFFDIDRLRLQGADRVLERVMDRLCDVE
jgi:hypothetical protein